MSPINPLFLDSTKPVGDKVLSGVEVTHILLRDGETLFLEVTDPAGLLQKFELREITTKKSAKFKAEIWLKHDSLIQYRFVIESSGQRLFASALHQTKAGSLIIEKWDPSFERPAPVSPQDEKATPRRQPASKSTKPARGAKSKAAKESFNPHLLGGIKSLLDDLL